MEANALPRYDASENPTNCCPKFNPEGWDEQDLHFVDKLFVKAMTRSLFHIPLNMGTIYPKTSNAIEAAEAFDMDQVIVLSHDISAWRAEHFFSVTKEVPGQEMVRLTGDFVTKVFEGPYKNAPRWEKELEAFVQSRGKQVKKTYFFYTTCPKCAKYYGKNYVIGVAEV
ncbi:MAG: hypothetical protein PVI92_08795 [Chromatiales bacterium]|jgi:hypothetical protein